MADFEGEDDFSEGIDPEAFADLRRGPDTLLEACRARDGAAAEEGTRHALMWVLAELQRMLDNAEAAEASA